MGRDGSCQGSEAMGNGLRLRGLRAARPGNAVATCSQLSLRISGHQSVSGNFHLTSFSVLMFDVHKTQ